MKKRIVLELSDFILLNSDRLGDRDSLIFNESAKSHHAIIEQKIIGQHVGVRITNQEKVRQGDVLLIV